MFVFLQAKRKKLSVSGDQIIISTEKLWKIVGRNFSNSSGIFLPLNNFYFRWNFDNYRHQLPQIVPTKHEFLPFHEK